MDLGRQFREEHSDWGNVCAIRQKDTNAPIICNTWSELVDRIEIFNKDWMVNDVSSRAVRFILDYSSNFARRKGVWVSNDPIPAYKKRIMSGSKSENQTNNFTV